MTSAEINETLDIFYKTSSSGQYGSKTDAQVERKKYTWQPGWAQGAFTKTFEDGSDVTYGAAQFHIHTPSEHTIDGRHTDMEMHIVHQDPSQGGGLKGLAVIGIFFDYVREDNYDTATNMFLDSWVNSSLNNSEGSFSAVPVNLQGLLDSMDMEEFWSYDGSLTTPPCTEGVKWTVMKHVQPMSMAQRDKLNQLGTTNRATQPLNDRVLREGGATAVAKANAAKWSAEESNDSMGGYEITTIIMSILFVLVLLNFVALIVVMVYCPQYLSLRHKLEEDKGIEVPSTERKPAAADKV